jgi:hypothetical protein
MSIVVQLWQTKSQHFIQTFYYRIHNSPSLDPEPDESSQFQRIPTNPMLCRPLTHLNLDMNPLSAVPCCLFNYSAYSQVTVHIGRAIPQAVSRRLPTAAARVQTRVWSCGILWWTNVALWQVFSENFGFPCQSTFHLFLHNHLHCHPRLAL